MASRQTAVSQREDDTFSSGIMEESEVCSLPGGLASVRKRFETQETATSHNVTQFHIHHRTVQEMSNSEVTKSCARQVTPGSQRLSFQDEVEEVCSGNNHDIQNEEDDEDMPRLTMRELRDHFERTIEEAAPSKPIKIGHDSNRSQWSSHVTHTTASSEMYEASGTQQMEMKNISFVDYDDSENFPPPLPEDSEYLPPPPPDLLQGSPASPDIPECCYSPELPEPVSQSKHPINKEAYFKQRNQYELKRLCKHIHPEVLKNIEREYYNDETEISNNHLETQEYVYEDYGFSPNNTSDSPDQEYLEWDEILQGEVQSMRWMFENKPLDAIKDETPDEEDDKKISQQEIIVGNDVRRTAWMFETKPMDELGSQNTESTEYRNKCNNLDKGDVRAAAWLFETKPMETLNRLHREEELTKEVVFTEDDENATIYMVESRYMETLGHTETIDESHLLSLRSVLEEIREDVKTVTSSFDTQFTCVLMGQSSHLLLIKSVRKIEMEMANSNTSRWLFDTQPLGMHVEASTAVKLVCSLTMEDNSKGQRGRWLFETKTLDSIKNDWDSSTTKREEIVGADVRKHCLVFETQQMDSLKDDSNARPLTVEDVIGGNVRSARHFFESSPKVVRKEYADVGKLKSIKTNEEERGDVRHQKWLFETKPLEQIREEKKKVVRTVNLEEELTQEDGTSCKADVRKNCWVFETQPMDTLKDDSNSRPLTREEVIAGNVRSARHYFESAPAEEIKDLLEVGRLQTGVTLDEERGDVRHQKWMFESHPLEDIGEEKKEIVRTINVEEIDKVDVSNYKQIFEMTDLSKWDESQKILVEGVTRGSVKSNKDIFESDQMYAMQDHFGHYHEVRTVRREEVVKGDVRSCKWMFETRPIDQFDESISKFQIIKGISKQEVDSGDVKTAKWLFETQPLDAIKYFCNIEDEDIAGTGESIDIVKGDVQTCKWLFETKPMEALYDKIQLNKENETEEIQKGDVKTCTWLFETQALDTIRDKTETILKTCTVDQQDVLGKDVRTARFLFETENLENISGEEMGSFKRVTEIDIASGDVSRMKYIFENQSSDIMTSTSEENMQKLKHIQSEDILKGNVVNCKWLFENQSVSTMSDGHDESEGVRTVNDVQGGNVGKGRFIFETYSLDKIQEVSSETGAKLAKILCEEKERGDVKNYTMMFETQPLYAIQDKEGHYHEVTTVTSEEVMRGDVVGSRWLFETKPLDSIRDTDEVYLIKSVTQQDVQKGDVSSAKWRFETQPLDRISEEKKICIKTVDDIQGGDVTTNKKRFESDALSQQSVQTVNVSEIQKGDVRTAKWMFETRTIDKIRSMSSENIMETVQKEEVVKGDVKQSVWLFERNPLDHIKEVNEEDEARVTREDIPKADVQTTTWLFETTPFHEFNESSIEKTEILGKNIKETLEELYSNKIVNSKGILLETDEIGDIRMAKYHLMNKQAPEIQREDIVKGDLKSIMMNLLNSQETNKRQIVIDSEEMGNISSTVQQLFNQERETNIEKEEILRGDIQEAVNNLLKEDGSTKRGILIQEDEMGDVRMTVYSLLHKQQEINVERKDIIKGNIKGALHMLYNPDNTDQNRIKVEDAEKGNVNFYSTCIESGALDYLKQLQFGPDENLPGKVKKEEIIGGDIKGTKLILGKNQTQIERTVVEEEMRGDVHNTVKVFMTEPSASLEGVYKEEIVKGDLKAAMNSLSQSVKQTVAVEKEQVVKGNIPKALRCLERAQKRNKDVEKPDIVRGNIRGALRSLEKSTTSKVETTVEDLVPGDVKGTLKSLELATHIVRDVEKEEIVKGDIQTALQCLQDASTEKRASQQQIDVQGDVRGTIQLLLEPSASQRMQRRLSFEGDVKTSIKSLYMQEQNQLEKEEVIKGDVKGTIKSLLDTAQRETPKIKSGAYRKVRVKQVAAVKNSGEQRNIQKIKTANDDKPVTSAELHSHFTDTHVDSTLSHSSKQITNIVEHKTITQKHGIKTLKTDFCNLNRRGMIKLDKTKVKRDIYVPQSVMSDVDLSLPLPSPPRTKSDLQYPTSTSLGMQDNDLPPPPTPPPPPLSTDCDHDHILSRSSEPDFLPPPPSQQELDNMPSLSSHPSIGKATKLTVKKVKALMLQKVPKLEPTVVFEKGQQETIETQSATSIKPLDISTEIPPPPPSPRPLKKVYIPVKLTPPPSPPPFMRGKTNTTRFNTPLIKSEEKFRQIKDELTPPTAPTPNVIPDSVNLALAIPSDKDSCVEKPKKSIALDFTEELEEKTVTQSQKGIRSSNDSNNVNVSDRSPSKPLITTISKKDQGNTTVITSAKHHVCSGKTSKVSSGQHITSSSSMKQRTLTSSSKQKASVTSKKSQSAVTIKAQTSTGAVKNIDSVSTDDKNKLKNVKTKETNKPEDRKLSESPAIPENNLVQSLKTEKITTGKIAKSVKSQQSEKKKRNDHSTSNAPEQNLTKDENLTTFENNLNVGKNDFSDSKKKSEKNTSQEQDTRADLQMKVEQVSSEANVKTVKKTKKNTKQANISEIKHVSQGKVEVRSVTSVTSSEHKQVESEVKMTQNTLDVDAATASTSHSPTIVSTQTKKKKKSRKSKGGTQAVQSKEAASLTESNTSISEKSIQNQEALTIIQTQETMQEEHIQFHEEVIMTEDKVNQSENEVQKLVKPSQKKSETIDAEKNQEKSTEKETNVPMKGTGLSADTEVLTENTDDSQKQEVQKLILHVTEILRVSENLDCKTVKTMLNTIPEWFMSPEEKVDLEGAAQNPQEIIEYVKTLAESKLVTIQGKATLEKHECEPIHENNVAGGTNRISRISIGSAKVEIKKEKKSSQESIKQNTCEVKFSDLRAPSPLLRMRPPSPTFITIESTRRTDSPQRVTPSPTLLYRPATPPTPPPRRSDTPTLRINRITCSPTFDRAENLPRLKDTTAKLSRGVTPPPLFPSQLVAEKKSEILESPASFHRQIKIEGQAVENKELLGSDLGEPTGMPLQVTNVSFHQTNQSMTETSSVITTSVRDKKDYFEEAQKAEINKTYIRKDPIDIPERLGPDTEEPSTETQSQDKDDLPRVNVSGLLNKFESSEEEIYQINEPVSNTGNFEGETKSTENDVAKADVIEEDMPTFDIQAIKKVFELDEQSPAGKVEKNKQDEQNLRQTKADSSKKESPQETKGSYRQNAPLPHHKDEKDIVSKPSDLSENNSVTEQFTNVDEFGNKITGTRTITTVSQQSESVSTHPAPVPVLFSYADAVKRKNAEMNPTESDETSTEELLRNFHKTWTESESVFKSLGYSVAEERTTHVVSHQTKTFANDSSSKVGALHTMSEEGVSDGCSNGGQKKVP